VVNGMRSFFTAAMPNAWLYVLGLLFIAVTLFFPDGVADALARLKRKS
jgi:urea transport system permease protein